MKNGLHVEVGGTKRWYLNGKCHRADGPAIERADGTKRWFLNGKLHRTDGPAVEDADGTKLWWLNGKLHRTDGPAIERANGDKAWWLNDEHLGWGDEGFWALWELLSDGQRNNLNLHMHLPGLSQQ